MGTSKALAALLFACSCSAYNFTELKARTTPNHTRSVVLFPFQGHPDFRSLTSWSWRVNITDEFLPNEETNFPVGAPKKTTPSTRAIAITYDISRPSDTNSTRDSQAFCVVYPYTISRMPNVTNLWPESTNTGNTTSTCAPVLGQGCVDRIVERAKESDGEGCDLDRAWWDIEECKDSFGYAHDVQKPRGWFGTLSHGLVGSGEGFNEISYVYDAGGDGKIYESAVNMLQVVLLYYKGDNGTPPSAHLACMRVKTDKLKDGDKSAGRRGGVDWWVTVGGLGLAMVMGL